MIINNAHLVTFWPSQPILEGALLAIEGKSIVDFGKVGKLADRYEHPEVLDVGGRVVLPGMINAHTRLYGSLLPGDREAMPDGLMERIEDSLEEETLYWTALVALLDALRSGVTTLFAWSSSPGHVERGLAPVERAFRETKARGALSFGLSRRSPHQASIQESLRHLESCGGSEKMQGLFGLSASSELSSEVLEPVVAAADRVGARFHVIVEDPSGGPGASLVSRLDDLGVWSRGGLAVPRGRLSSEDEALLRARDVTVVHTPRSDTLEALSSPDLLRGSASGLHLGLGTNGFGQSLAEELLGATLRERQLGRKLIDAIAFPLRAAFTGNADLATRTFGPDLGRIKPGARADLVVLDYRPATALEESNFRQHLFWGALRAPVHTTIVNGRIVYQNHQFPGLDEERIRARAREAFGKLWERL